MKTLIISAALLVAATSAPVWAIDLKTGENFTSSTGEVFRCAPNKCLVEFVYVGTKYSIKLPNGKEFGTYPTKDEAFKEIEHLIALKICETVEFKDKPQ